MHKETKEAEVQEVDFIIELNEELKKLECIRELFICESYAREFNEEDERILKEVKIPIHREGQECGKVDIGEYISLYLDAIKYQGKPERVFSKNRNPFNGPTKIPIFRNNKSGPSEELECKITPEESEKISQFEKSHIKQSGPSDTIIGELFRAFQRIKYRAGNDGDNFMCIGTPSFESMLFIMSILDTINWSWIYEKEIKLKNPLLEVCVFDNRIHWEGELFEIKFIQLILIELLETGVIVDRPNNMDSRDFTTIKKSRDWDY
jgi:hypothetical protein